MDNTYLNSDEPVLITARKIIIGGIRYEVALTGKRILLADEDSGKVVGDILFAAVGSVSAGENALREPTLTLTIVQQEGESRTVGLIFARQPGGLNTQERDRIFSVLRDHGVPVSGEHAAAAEDTSVKPDAQNWMPVPYQNKVRQPPPEVPGKERSPLVTIAAIIIILIVIAGIAIVYEPFGKGTGGSHPAVTVPTVPVVPATTATLTPVPATVQPTPATQPGPATSSGISIPATGVWVRVTSAGNYSGYVSAQGWTVPVSGAGDQIYSIPARGGRMDGSIEKQDLSANRLQVEVYQDGTLVSVLNTTKPEGLIDFHVTLPQSTAVIGTVFTPTPAPAVPALFLPPAPVPKTGVWVRVYYPGNFTGSLGYLGFQTPVNSTGDQFYQMPIRNGDVIGSIEKEDGSVNDLVVAIYKDGVLVRELDTAVPKGIIYLHEPV